MLPCATFSVAGTTTGVPTIFSSEFRQLGYHAETVRSRKLRIHFSCSCRAKERPSQRFLKLNSKRRSTLLTFAFGKEAEDSFFSDVGEDTDEMYDELFKNYGKVVFKRKDQKPATAEVDDDAESLSFAVEMAKVASEVKAADIKVLFVKPLVYWTRFFIIATAFSRPQIDAIGSRIRDLAEKKYGKFPTGDSKPNSWTLLDFGDVVVHIFLPPQRAFYNLEEFYGNATPVELPFENQPPFRN
ncbi:protein Iojap, chloroplastic [Arachis stenosperma]|uniref:protein Iojap, chloroplastic n=1 Tax=Arachis stenosperma TaxID=217475 RepID=UPI0025ABA9E4|nr:protein Iojap, chloroplastic [Arachis stenosperma]